MIDYIYMIIMVLWVAVLTGFIIKDTWILMFTGLIMLTVGIFTLVTGLTGVENLAVTAFSFLHIGVGFYLIIKSTEELIGK